MNEATPLRILRDLEGGPFGGDSLPLPSCIAQVTVYEPEPGWFILSVTGEGRVVGHYIRERGDRFVWHGPEGAK